MPGEASSIALGLAAARPNLRKPAPVHALHGNGVEVDAVEASNIDPPQIGRRARAPERENPASLAEVVSRDMGMKGVEREIIQRREQPEELRLHPMNKGAAPPTNRAVADADMIQLGVNLEPNAPAVAGASIGRSPRTSHCADPTLCLRLRCGVSRCRSTQPTIPQTYSRSRSGSRPA